MKARARAAAGSPCFHALSNSKAKRSTPVAGLVRNLPLIANVPNYSTTVGMYVTELPAEALAAVTALDDCLASS